MHTNNRRWLSELRHRHLAHFHGAKVLEIGSRIWTDPPNHTIRPFFTECDYVGVDQLAGPGVDVVASAQATAFSPGQFDTLAMFSLFEHDPTWRDTLSHNLQWLHEGGLFITCFGAEGNMPHLMNWKAVPHREFLDFCTTVPVRLSDWFFEEDRYGPDCSGCFNAEGWKS